MKNEKIEKAVELGKSAEMIVFEAEPFNGGAAVEGLIDNFITETPLFYVRNHGTIPDIMAADFRLQVGGMVEKKLELSLAELKTRFETHSITATMQCAGNRRDEMIAVREIPGEIPWLAHAISCGEWRGVRLADVLKVAGVESGARHVAFDGADEVTKNLQTNFGGSIPLEKAMADEVLLAFEMNGEELLPIHGAPLRVVVPGYIGARSVKWLTKITVQTEPSDNHFQAAAYKIFPPQINKSNVDWSQGLMLGEALINSAICKPQAEAELKAGKTTLRGYATSGGGRSVERVDVSIDGGENWLTAELLDPKKDASGEPNPSEWAWRFWQCEAELTAETNELIVRAYDAAANTQPDNIAPLWNFKGYMNNGWHRIKVRVER